MGVHSWHALAAASAAERAHESISLQRVSARTAVAQSRTVADCACTRMHACIAGMSRPPFSHARTHAQTGPRNHGRTRNQPTCDPQLRSRYALGPEGWRCRSRPMREGVQRSAQQRGCAPQRTVRRHAARRLRPGTMPRPCVPRASGATARTGEERYAVQRGGTQRRALTAARGQRGERAGGSGPERILR